MPAFPPAAMTMSTSVNARILAIISTEIDSIPASEEKQKKYTIRQIQIFSEIGERQQIQRKDPEK